MSQARTSNQQPADKTPTTVQSDWNAKYNKMPYGQRVQVNMMSLPFLVVAFGLTMLFYFVKWVFKMIFKGFAIWRESHVNAPTQQEIKASDEATAQAAAHPWSDDDMTSTPVTATAANTAASPSGPLFPHVDVAVPSKVA